jgi:hypothetical protein
MSKHRILAIEPDPLFQKYLLELLQGKFKLDCVASFAEGKRHQKESKTWWAMH